MLEIHYTNKIKKDIKILQKRRKDMSKFRSIVQMLEQEIELPKRYKDHALSGDYFGFRECHLEPDWLLIYRVKDGILELARTGRHQDVFKKY